MLHTPCTRTGPDGDAPVFSFKYLAVWIERELRALLLEEVRLASP